MMLESAWILRISRQKIFPLSRLTSSKLTPHRCFLNAPNITKPERTLKTGLYPAGAVSRSSHTSSLSSIARTGVYRGCGLKTSNPVAYTRYIHSSGVSPRIPQDLAVAQSYLGCSRSFHTSGRRLVIPPHVWLFIKPVQKLLAILFGRHVRRWWKSLPSNKRQLFKESVRQNKWKVSLGVGALGFFFIIFYVTHLEETPVTGRSRLLVFRKEHYDLLTSVEYETMMEEFQDAILPAEDERYQLVQKIVEHLISCNQDLPEVSKIQWTINLVDKPDINALVLPNGQVFVFTGLLNAVADVNQLSFILGHELAHAILEHTAEKASASHFLDFLLLISLTLIWAICPLDSLAIVGQWIQSKLRKFLFDQPYSRALEAEADEVGLQLSAKACMDVRASSVFWKQMEVSATLKGQPQVPEWLSTHPSHENRAEHLDRLIPKAIKLRQSCKCPDLPSTDPRSVFEKSVKQLLQNHRDSDNKAITSAAKPLQVDDKVAVAALVKGS